MHAYRGSKHHVFPGPPIVLQQCGSPAYQSIGLWHRQGRENPVGPSDGNQFTVRIHGNFSAHTRIDGSRLAQIPGGSNRRNLNQAERPIGGNEPRVNVLPLTGNLERRLFSLHDGRLRANRDDFLPFNQELTALDTRP